METITLILPNWTLSYLFDGDASGLNNEEFDILDSFIIKNLEKYKTFWALDSKDIGFTHSNRLDNFASDCSEVTFDITPKENNS